MKHTLRFLFDVAVYAVCGFALLLAPLRYARKRFGSGKITSIWAGTPIINLATNARAERLLGVDSRSLVYSTYFITAAFDRDLSRWAAIPLFGRVVPLAVFTWACLVADRLHFYCDRGLLPPRAPFTFDVRELYVYKMLGIPVFLWTYGADIRNRTISRAMGDPNTCTHCDAPGRHCVCDPIKAANNIKKLSRLSKAVFAGVGDMFGYTPGSVDNTYFWPIDLAASHGEKYKPAFPQPQAHRPFRVVHSTNHRMFKGTDYLIKAVAALKNDGVNVELVLVEGLPNEEALGIYRSADVVFDNCIMGNIGYFGLEAMALGKPVMCFIRHPDRYLLAPDECPVINTHVTTLKDDLRRLIERPHQLTEIGKRGRLYIERHFSLEAFAGRLKRAYERVGISP